MSNVLFGADFHLGHKAICKYRPQFRDEQDHFEAIEKAYHDRVTKRDKCYLSGDIAFTEEMARRIAKWPGQKVLVAGNHCTEHVPMNVLVECFDEVHAMVKYKEFWITHAPIHPAELRGKVNIHGHVHHATINDCRYFNTSLENIDFKLISLHEIRDIIAVRKAFYQRYFDGVAQFDIESQMGLSMPAYDFHNNAYAIPTGLK